MTTLQGYNQVTDYTFMFDLPDLRSNKVLPKYDKDSITGFIFNDKNFTIFKYLLETSQNEARYNDIQAYFTLFVTPDDRILRDFEMAEFTNMDLYTARQFILYNTIPKVIKPDILLNLKDITNVSTRINSQYVQLQNFNGTLHVNDSKILYVKECKNGIIYVIDKVLFPDPVYN